MSTQQFCSTAVCPSICRGQVKKIKTLPVRSQSLNAEILGAGRKDGDRLGVCGSKEGLELRVGRHTPKKKNTLTSGRKERKAIQGEAELRSTGCRSPRMARGWPAGGGLDPGEAAPPCPGVKCSGPVRARRPGAGSGGARPGRQGRGQGAAQQPSVHTHCAIPQQRRPAGGPTRPHAHTQGPARPSDTGETRDEVGRGHASP